MRRPELRPSLQPGRGNSVVRNAEMSARPDATQHQTPCSLSRCVFCARSGILGRTGVWRLRAGSIDVRS